MAKKIRDRMRTVVKLADELPEAEWRPRNSTIEVVEIPAPAAGQRVVLRVHDNKPELGAQWTLEWDGEQWMPVSDPLAVEYLARQQARAKKKAEILAAERAAAKAAKQAEKHAAWLERQRVREQHATKPAG